MRRWQVCPSTEVYTRAVGIPSYGIDGIFDDRDDGRAHGRGERIGVRVFAEELEFSHRLMRAIGDTRWSIPET